MTCKLSGLFNIGDDFDDEDVLGTDWSSAAASSGVPRTSAVAHQDPQRISLQPSREQEDGLRNGPVLSSSTHTTAGQTVALGLRQLSSSSSSSSRPPTLSLASNQSHVASNCLLEEFDDWDVDLADLDECEGQIGQQPTPTPPPPPPPPPLPPLPAAAPPALHSSTKTLRPWTSGGIQAPPDRIQKEILSVPSSSTFSFPLRACSSPRSPILRQSFPCPGNSTPPAPPTLPKTLHRAPQTQRTWTTPRPSPQSRSLFQTVSSAPPSSSSSPSVNSSTLSPHPLHTPVLTNRLVQLVSASTKLPRKRPRSEPQQRRTRLFPGPAGLLPQQLLHQNLDQIVVSAPQTPAHGCVARLPSQGSSSQSEEEEFSGGAWAAMKAEMGLDERNPSCFLHSYSVVMVLRKAALKQLSRNKVPNMAVLLKSIIHTHADAKAVFKDPTGEIQGTVHRCLLEDAADKLKVGAVLLLKQVGVFSPSHRNHYLNVTPNNLLRVYGPDGVRHSSSSSSSSSQLPPLLLEPVTLSPARSAPALPETVSCMQLAFDDDEEEDGRERHKEEAPPGAAGPSRALQGNTTGVSQWDADDDLDELLGELPEDPYCL